MSDKLILGLSNINRQCGFCLVYMLLCFGVHSSLFGQVQGDGILNNNTFSISSFSYQSTVLKPYGWRYIKVDLPPWFSSVSIDLESDADLDQKNIVKASSSRLPIICFREGSPPLPDVYNISLTSLVSDNLSNDSFGGFQGLQVAEQCYPMQKILSVKWTIEQISPSTWYIGLFNGIGPVRTQSKMINPGRSYSFSGNISVEGCISPLMSGQFCNQTVQSLSCMDKFNYYSGDNQVLNHTEGTIVACSIAVGGTCHEDDGPKLFSLSIVGMSEKLIIKVSNITNNSGIVLMSYARLGAFPSSVLHDYVGNISDTPLVIDSPKLGNWYVMIQPVISPNKDGVKVCYSSEWQVIQCPLGMTGPNCTFKTYMLQDVVYLRGSLVATHQFYSGTRPDVRFDFSQSNVAFRLLRKSNLSSRFDSQMLLWCRAVLRRNPSSPFEAFYLPMTEKVSDSANFPLEPFLSNSSYAGNDGATWTFFLVNIPSGAAGGNIHIHLVSDKKINYEVYARYGGFPSLSNWDYYVSNSSSNSNGSVFYKMYDFSEKSMSFYVLYAREGAWSFGLRHLSSDGLVSEHDTTMSISLERCPQKCSSHGTCVNTLDTSGLTLYSFCDCDRDHGGFDCSIELVTHKGNEMNFFFSTTRNYGHIWQSIALIASNAAAILPAYWAIRHKAFAEWILYTSSGISSGLYHACDVGTWCVLPFHVLQFMDFWLSFMAVISTFIYLAAIDETSRRTIHTVAAILTALMAENGPTRSSNIILVISIGALGLVTGWLIELCTHYRSSSWRFNLSFNMIDRWPRIGEWLLKLVRTLLKRFRWAFLVAGFTAVAMAAISWKLETTQTYWIWHSLWHISIYTSSFLFLCSKAEVLNCEDVSSPDGPPDEQYALTREESSSGHDQRGR